MLDSTVQNLRFAIRHWVKSPGFTIAAALVIALGIGATTTVFSVADALLIRTPPGVRGPESLVTMRVLDPHEKEPWLFSYPEFREVRDGDNGLSGVAALDIFAATVKRGDAGTEPEVVSGMMVSGNYFSILGTKPARGRFFRPEEDREGSPIPVVVLSHRYWTRRMGSDPAVIGQTITINRARFTVIGVAEEGFQGHVAAYDFSLWIPIAMAETVTPIELTSRGYRGLSIIGRASGSSLERVRTATARIAEQMRREHPQDMDGRSIAVERYRKLFEEVRGPITAYMGLLLALAMTVLGIASVNVGGMLLSRAAGRTREMGIRLALGANRGALVRQLLAEYALLFLLGGGLGVLLSYWAMGVLETLHLPTPVPVALDLTVNGRVLSFTLVCALFTGVVFGLAPARQATWIDARSTLALEGAASAARGNRIRRSFVIAQVAASLVLLATSGVLVRALGRAGDVDLGFDPAGVHVVGVDLSLLRYSDEAAAAFLDALRDRASRLPGVEHVAVARVLPLGFTSIATNVDVPGRAPNPSGEETMTDIDFVTSDFFATLGMRLVDGRTYDAAESASGNAVVLNRTAAERYWPGERAVGKTLRVGDVERVVVGVVADGKIRTLGEESRAMAYVPPEPQTTGEVFLLLRRGPGMPSPVRDLREIVADLDPDVPVGTNRPYEQLIGVSLLPNEVAAGLAGSFGLVGMLLTAIGLYGVLTYAVVSRTRELGIRMALGAEAGAIRWMVLAQGLGLVLVGLIAGLPLAMVATWFLRANLFGISPADPLSFSAVAALLAAVCGAASCIPAWRASAVDPSRALRWE
jgi:putative ABC transport system permease protein